MPAFCCQLALKMHLFLVILSAITALACAENITTSAESYVHPIEIDGKHFRDSVTGERFLIRGIDYQPGGSASYNKYSDPLSDEAICARDIYLFQQLNINTVRVYTVNPRLNHDACMTMFAAANIYLLLDVNSPLVGESINRYEPWTTYTPDYLRHVFEVVDQFSRYNNTLGYFIGNEIVNDERSASVSPPYIKAVARDVKDYMYYNCIRSIPLGYSAADDLRYRKDLSHYLTCGARETAVDFYGVNSYQWCGQQTLRTSGYDVLIKDHADFQVPVFFSEFGCNIIKPRLFQEVSAIYSQSMTDTFSGGLVYEFSQEENDYGLVDIDNSGNAFLREEFGILQQEFGNVHTSKAETTTVQQNSSTSTSRGQPPDNNRRPLSSKEQLQSCKSSYPNLSGARLDIPSSFGTDMIRNGVRVQRGKYLRSVLEQIPTSKYNITRFDGTVIPNARMTVVNDFRAHVDDTARGRTDKGRKETANDEKSGKGRKLNKGGSNTKEKQSKNEASSLKESVAASIHNNRLKLLLISNGIFLLI